MPRCRALPHLHWFFVGSMLPLHQQDPPPELGLQLNIRWYGYYLPVYATPYCSLVSHKYALEASSEPCASSCGGFNAVVTFNNKNVYSYYNIFVQLQARSPINIETKRRNGQRNKRNLLLILLLPVLHLHTFNLDIST